MKLYDTLQQHNLEHYQLHCNILFQSFQQLLSIFLILHLYLLPSKLLLYLIKIELRIFWFTFVQPSKDNVIPTESLFNFYIISFSRAFDSSSNVRPPLFSTHHKEKPAETVARPSNKRIMVILELVDELSI
jgi:hypothetical protein